ncbi:NAD(P)H-binding protein [Novosphingobium profundi]|uniref:NAD(P)H-binding protein n=1 Tax=Novosphingobium profundi TaxID=1774954 RepID=UPI001BD9A4FA|nr:NAD(P)H-binding protein [Novosphingobium profundi]MBT0670014.1 NAD(P)H-binding protein [Novosphingobium profundi]
MTRERILVAGATGRVGSDLVARLCARGLGVRALVRGDAGALDPRAERVVGDLRCQVDIQRAVEGCTHVAFVAGVNAIDGRGTSREVECEAVAAMAKACRQPDFARFVLLSSAGVTQREHPHNCTFGSVLAWKRLGEETLRASGVPYVIVRALGLRDRPAGEAGVRLVQGDRIAFGEDIARGDVAAFLADVLVPRSADGFPCSVTRGSVANTSFEIFNDASLAGGTWEYAPCVLAPDPQGQP